jgi:hypothetical protein
LKAASWHEKREWWTYCVQLKDSVALETTERHDTNVKRLLGRKTACDAFV